jgi:ATP-dependent DNA helicase RecQ
MLDISGVGQVKARQYGELFLGVIKPYCEKHNLNEKPHPRPSPTRRGESESPSPSGRRARDEGEIGERTRIVGEVYNAGDSVQSLMKRYNVTANTILDHLMRYVSAGNKLRKDNDLQSLVSSTPDQQQAAFAAFDELDTALLKPVFDKLNGKLSYDELKILRMMYLMSTQE